MPLKVLVAYASRFGSTREIAVAIGDELQQEGVDVRVCAAEDVGSVATYDGAIIGSCVHRGHWLPAATELVRSRPADLGRVPVALFTVHISNPTQAQREAFLDDVRPFVRPVAQCFFHGRFDRRGAALLIPRPLAWLVPPIDLRRWARIRAWPHEIAPLLRSSRLRDAGVSP